VSWLRDNSKKWVKAAISETGALRAAALLAPQSAVILMYHSVVEDPRQTAATIRISQSRASFERQMATLARRFNVVTLDQVVSFVSEGLPIPRRSVVVTFDDGFADNFETALPILTRYGIPATFYVLVGAVDSGTPPWYCRLAYAFNSTMHGEWKQPNANFKFNLHDRDGKSAAMEAAWDIGAALSGSAQQRMVEEVEATLEVQAIDARSRLMMNWDQVRALKNAGHTIGGHSLTHPNLAHVSAAEAKAEIFGCKEALEAMVGSPAKHFCYPHPALNPQWTPDTKEITREAGFQSAVLTTPGSVRRGDDILSLRRIPASEDSERWIWDLERAFVG